MSALPSFRRVYSCAVAIAAVVLLFSASGCGDEGNAGSADSSAAEAGGGDAESSSDVGPGGDSSEDALCEAAHVGAPPLGSTITVTPQDGPGVAACLAAAGEEQILVEAWANKIAMLEVGNGGYPGEGLDVDGDPATCAPATLCDGGIDNRLGALHELANDGMGEALDQGTLTLLLTASELDRDPSGAATFSLNMYTAYIDPLDEDCDWQSAACEYRVRTDSFDAGCRALMELPATADVSGAVVAGSADSTLLLTIPLFGLQVQVTAYAVRLEGSMAFDCEGRPVNVEGVLGGAIATAELKAALEAIPAEEYEAAGTSKNLVVGAVDLLTPDFDGNGDGIPEGITVGLRFGTIGAVVVGVTEPAK